MTSRAARRIGAPTGSSRADRREGGSDRARRGRRTRPGRAEAFRKEREALNALVLRYAGLPLKRFLSVDSMSYRDGALSARTKEMLGLVASLVLRCDDCVTYHILRCREEGVTDAEIVEALSVGLVVGGSITIPHLRRALRIWDEMARGGRRKP